MKPTHRIQYRSRPAPPKTEHQNSCVLMHFHSCSCTDRESTAKPVVGYWYHCGGGCILDINAGGAKPAVAIQMGLFPWSIEADTRHLEGEKGVRTLLRRWSFLPWWESERLGVVRRRLIGSLGDAWKREIAWHLLPYRIVSFAILYIFFFLDR
jgi:hypothetical protein